MKNSVQRFGKFLSAMIIGPLSNMPMTAIEYFGKLGEKDPFFKELDACCKRNKELRSKEAEVILFEYFGGKEA